MTVPREPRKFPHHPQPEVYQGSARTRSSPCVEGARVQSQTSSPTAGPPPRHRFIRAWTTRLSKTAATLATTLALIAGGVITAAPAFADEIGQAPTAANITGNGSFATTSSTITGQSGFGGGTVYYPTTAGKYPV